MNHITLEALSQARSAAGFAVLLAMVAGASLRYLLSNAISSLQRK